MSENQIHRGVYNCPNCGAAASPESVRCGYCRSSLATLVCSSCFGAIFTGMKHCPWCGAEAAAGKPVEVKIGDCPRCSVQLLAVEVGDRQLFECGSCGGLWVGKDTLQQICADREEQQAVMSCNFQPAAAPAGAAVQRTYIPCPECKKLMNRKNFAQCSGVIVDWCKEHGTWFDRDELKRIVQFVQDGGLSKSRDVEKSRLEEQRLHIEEEKRNLIRIARLADAGSTSCRDADLLDLVGGIWSKLRD